MGILFLFLLALAFMFLGLIPSQDGFRGGRRIRTAREDALYSQVQAAMNWEPGMPRQCECGGYVNEDGEHLKVMTLTEAMEWRREETKCPRIGEHDTTRAKEQSNDQ